MSSFLFWFLNFVPFMLKLVLFYQFKLSAKMIHKYIGRHRSLLINMSASEILQYAFSENDMVFRVLGFWHYKLRHFVGSLLRWLIFVDVLLIHQSEHQFIWSDNIYFPKNFIP